MFIPVKVQIFLFLFSKQFFYPNQQSYWNEFIKKIACNTNLQEKQTLRKKYYIIVLSLFYHCFYHWTKKTQKRFEKMLRVQVWKKKKCLEGFRKKCLFIAVCLWMNNQLVTDKAIYWLIDTCILHAIEAAFCGRLVNIRVVDTAIILSLLHFALFLFVNLSVVVRIIISETLLARHSHERLTLTL